MHQEAQGQTVRCPSCRQLTTLPQTGIPGLQGAFHVHHLFDIQDTLRKVNKANCDKCKTQEATVYCRICGFVCDRCKKCHQFFEELTSHEIVSLNELTGELTSVVPPQKKVLLCPRHEGKQLELFCETCSELVCHNCTTKIHKGHSCDVVSDTFEAHKAEILSSLKPIQQQLATVKQAREQVTLRHKGITDRQAALEVEIASFAEKMIAAINSKKQALMEGLAETTHHKLKILLSQEDEIQMVETRLSGCLEVVERSLQTGTQGEVLAAKKTILKKIKDLTADFQPQSLPPREQADTKLAPSDAALECCGRFAELYTVPCPEKCTLQGVPEMSFTQTNVTAVLQTLKANGEKIDSPYVVISSTLISSDGTTTVSGTVQKTGMGRYELHYTTPSKSGQYKLHVKIEGQPIQASPFHTVIVRDLRAPVKIIDGLNRPLGVAVNKRGQVIVSEYGGHCITVFSEGGDMIRSFGAYDSAPGQLRHPRGIAVDEDDNIIVADAENGCIQKFSPQGEHLETVGKQGKNVLEFKNPSGVGIHPLSKKVYVTEGYDNHRIQVLDASLKHVTMFGGHGKGELQFNQPKDISFDRAGNCYVTDRLNHRVVVFSENGQYLRQFGKEGEGQGELKHCHSLTIDSDIVYVADTNNHRISVFTTDGTFITSFGTEGNGPGQFRYPQGVTTDENGRVYVSDCDNGRVQIL